VRRPTWVTSGTSAIKVSASAPMRLASASAVPGVNTMPSTSEPSLNAGRNARGKNGTLAAAAATASAATAISALARANDQFNTRSSRRLSQATNALSPWSSRFMRGSRYWLSTGVTVIDTSMEASTETM